MLVVRVRSVCVLHWHGIHFDPYPILHIKLDTFDSNCEEAFTCVCVRAYFDVIIKPNWMDAICMYQSLCSVFRCICASMDNMAHSNECMYIFMFVAVCLGLRYVLLVCSFALSLSRSHSLVRFACGECSTNSMIE